MKIEKLALIQTLPTCLTSRVLGQCDALATIGTWGRSWLAGVLEKAPRVLLLGPTGVGKTECALALSEAMTGRAPARLDMSEFQLQESVGSLLGDRVADAGRLSPLLVQTMTTCVRSIGEPSAKVRWPGSSICKSKSSTRG